MLEKRLKKKNFRLLVYVVGCLLELIGFALLFNIATSKFLMDYHILIGAFIVFSGYCVAVAMRFKN